MTNLWRCSVCKKAGTEDDFVWAPIDDTHENIFCFDCAPEEALRQTWGEESEQEGESVVDN